MTDRPYRIEVCVETREEAIIAERNGAHQVELCSRLDLDGLSPEKDLIESVLGNLNIHVKVLIRPREGNFIYSIDEIEQMKKQILICKNSGVREVVIGALNKKSELDMPTIISMAESAKPMQVSVHKCIDFCKDPIKEIEKLKSLGILKSILTSGGRQTGIEGISTLKKMMFVCGNEIELIPAGKITPQNIKEIHELLNARTYHGKNILYDPEN